MKWYILFPVFLFSQITGKVIKISDGDNLYCLKDNHQKKIRLAEVDCSEKRKGALLCKK
ncbi:endonuclease YncB(thermonuclease family) [Chryseobacterium sediminis]|uniref:Endonuclease YncB(Thermonuclease family) n=1 Tax=Chryseobacterium sediminis TaxID=1679494 RepID=A0ABR6PTP8_9FLAO|nr:hypothetical protein [Chryseobacterium sediminis]MBB6329076.1 endonuclease YncB(thermonuclease family) [Chryseobacterium sediminis]